MVCCLFYFRYSCTRMFHITIVGLRQAQRLPSIRSARTKINIASRHDGNLMGDESGAREHCVYDTILCYVFIGNFTSFRLLVGAKFNRNDTKSSRLPANHPTVCRFNATPAAIIGEFKSNVMCVCAAAVVGLFAGVGFQSKCLSVVEAGIALWIACIFIGSERFALHLSVSCATAASFFSLCRWGEKSRFVSAVAVCPRAHSSQSNRQKRDNKKSFHRIQSDRHTPAYARASFYAVLLFITHVNKNERQSNHPDLRNDTTEVKQAKHCIYIGFSVGFFLISLENGDLVVSAVRPGFVTFSNSAR